MVDTLIVFFLFFPAVLSGKSEQCPLYEEFSDSTCFSGDRIDEYLTHSPTVWVVEFYSSWCGHCHHFSPTWKSVATRIKSWSSLVRMGQIDCTQSNCRDKCTQYHIEAFPTIKIFKPNTNDPHSKDIETYIGRRSQESLIEAIISHINSVPLLEPLNSFNTDSIDVLVFEDKESQPTLGKEIILNFLSSHKITIRRVLSDNVELIRHYSILELPSLVIMTSSNHHTVISRSAAGEGNVREYFEKTIRDTLLLLPSPPTHIPQSHDSLPTGVERNLTPSIKRVTMTDLLSTVSYCLRYEINLKHVIENEKFYILYRFLYHLEKVFRVINRKASHDLRSVVTKLDKLYIAGFMTMSEWQGILRQKIHNKTFPIQPNWITCNGSQPQYRGFPCGLWSLMHTATVLSLNTSSASHNNNTMTTNKSRTIVPTNSRQVLSAMVGFVVNFFSCSECREHFSKLTRNLHETPLNYDGDAILWLWETHNIVNRRLRDSASSDPRHPKVLFPSYQVCPYCYQKVQGGGSHLQESQPNWENVALERDYKRGLLFANGKKTVFIWNETAIFLFLCNFYGQGHYDNISHTKLVQAGWPRKYPLSLSRHYSINGVHSNTPTTLSSFNLIIYLFVAAGILAYVLNFKLKRTRFKSH